MELSTICLYSCLFISFLKINIQGTEWHHDVRDEKQGPLHWKSHFPTCGGSKQSPIHIWTDTTFILETADPTFHFEVSHDKSELELKNTGHGGLVSYKNYKPIMYGAGLTGKYVLQQFHFHSGNGSARGSEHLVDSDEYYGEAHFVFFNSDVNPKDVLSTTNPMGLAVLGVLLKKGGNDHMGYAALLDEFSEIYETGAAVNVSYVDFRDLLPEDLTYYYRYQGSLTTPPCSEVVEWTVFRDAVYLSEAQVAKFVNIKSRVSAGGSHEKEVPITYRPLQALHGRRVYRSWVTPGDNIRASSQATGHVINYAIVCLFTLYALGIYNN